MVTLQLGEKSQLVLESASLKLEREAAWRTAYESVSPRKRSYLAIYGSEEKTILASSLQQ